MKLQAIVRFARSIFLIVPAWLLCLVGAAAAGVGWAWLERHCARQLRLIYQRVDR